MIQIQGRLCMSGMISILREWRTWSIGYWTMMMMIRGLALLQGMILLRSHLLLDSLIWKLSLLTPSRTTISGLFLDLLSAIIVFLPSNGRIGQHILMSACPGSGISLGFSSPSIFQNHPYIYKHNDPSYKYQTGFLLKNSTSHISDLISFIFFFDINSDSLLSIIIYFRSLISPSIFLSFWDSYSNSFLFSFL